MPAGNQSLQPFIPTVFTTQSATAYKGNLDSNSSIIGNPAASFYVYPQNPATMSVNVDVGFTYFKTGIGVALNNGAGSIPVALVAPGSNSYYATIYFDPTINNVGVVYSTTGASPTPILPELRCQIPLAVVLIPSTAVTIQATMITDVRGSVFASFGKIVTLAGNTTYNVMGASDIQLIITYTAAMTLTLTNLQMGVPVSIILFNSTGGALVFKIAATSPVGTAYAILGDSAGASTNLTTVGYNEPSAQVHPILLVNPATAGGYQLQGPII
jgi:hypothetical protein